MATRSGKFQPTSSSGYRHTSARGLSQSSFVTVGPPATREAGGYAPSDAEIFKSMPPMTREAVALAEALTKPWVEVCKHVRERGKSLTLNISRTLDALQKKAEFPEGAEGDALKAEHIGGMFMTSIAIDNIGKPVVEYVVERELVDAFALTPFPSQ